MPIEVIPFNIGVEHMSDELCKWHISDGIHTPWPFTPVFHRFRGPDKGDPHDHPFGFQSVIMHGSYIERVFSWNEDGWGVHHDILRKTGDSFFVPATHIHQIIALPEGECWTMIIPKPWERETCFWRFDDDGNIYRRQWNSNEWQMLTFPAKAEDEQPTDSF